MARCNLTRPSSVRVVYERPDGSAIALEHGNFVHRDTGERLDRVPTRLAPVLTEDEMTAIVLAVSRLPGITGA